MVPLPLERKTSDLEWSCFGRELIGLEIIRYLVSNDYTRDNRSLKPKQCTSIMGNLYSIFYPDGKKPLETRHTAGTDVKMLTAVASFFWGCKTVS